MLARLSAIPGAVSWDNSGVAKMSIGGAVALTGKMKTSKAVRRYLRVISLSVLLAGATAGCSNVPGIEDLWGSSESSSSSSDLSKTRGTALAPDLASSDESKPIAELYNKGLKSLEDRQYQSANKYFSEVESQHPYSKWATRAILMQAYAQYQRNSYDDAINAAKRFITLHPGHRDAAYAYYLLAICYYEQIIDVKRDQTATDRALAALKEVWTRYPGTSYARDAESKAVLARDHLAGKNMAIGRYYLRKRAYLAAINRFKTVVEKYQTTNQTPEALYRLTEAYLSLGVRGEAQTAAAVLGHNYPNSDWYKDAYRLLGGQGLEPSENKNSWISRAIRSVTG